jgi:hypothetical protein
VNTIDAFVEIAEKLTQGKSDAVAAALTAGGAEALVTSQSAVPGGLSGAGSLESEEYLLLQTLGHEILWPSFDYIVSFCRSTQLKSMCYHRAYVHTHTLTYTNSRLRLSQAQTYVLSAQSRAHEQLSFIINFTVAFTVCSMAE